MSNLSTIPPVPRRSTLLAIVILLAACLSVSTMDAIAKHLSDRYDVLQLTWMRYLVQAILLFAITPVRVFTVHFRTRRAGLHMLRGLLVVGATFSIFTAVKYMPLAEANAIAFTTPLLITVLSIPLLGEKVGIRRWAALAVGFSGVLVIVRPALEFFHWAALMPLAFAACSALFHVTTPILGRNEDPTGSLHYACILGIVLPLPLVLNVWVQPAVADLAFLLALGALGTLGHLFLVRAFANAPASTLSPFIYSNLIWSSILDLMVFGDLPDGYTFAGAAMIIASGLYTYHRERRLEHASARRPAAPTLEP